VWQSWGDRRREGSLWLFKGKSGELSMVLTRLLGKIYEKIL
jgi:hypothetical protein